MRKRAALIALCLGCFAAMVMNGGTAEAAEIVTISSFEVWNTLLPDGSVDVRERVEYQLSGEGTTIIRKIPRTDGLAVPLEYIEVSEEVDGVDRTYLEKEGAQAGDSGVYELGVSASEREITVYVPNEGTQSHTMHYHYRITGGCEKYDDMARIRIPSLSGLESSPIARYYWSLCAEQGEGLEAYYYGTGEGRFLTPLAGEEKLSWFVENVQPNSEMRWEVFTTLANVPEGRDYVSQSGATLYNEAKAALQRRIDARGLINVWEKLAPVIEIVVGLCALYIGRIAYTEWKLSRSIPELWTFRPAFVQCALEPVLSARGVNAMLLDLARRHYIRIVRDEEELTLRREKKPANKLSEAEKSLLHELFPTKDQGSRALTGLAEEHRESPQKARDLFRRLQVQLRREGEELGLGRVREKAPWAPRIAVLLGAGSLLATVFLRSETTVLDTAVTVLLAITTWLVGRMKRAGQHVIEKGADAFYEQLSSGAAQRSREERIVWALALGMARDRAEKLFLAEGEQSLSADLIAYFFGERGTRLWFSDKAEKNRNGESDG